MPDPFAYLDDEYADADYYAALDAWDARTERDHDDPLPRDRATPAKARRRREADAAHWRKVARERQEVEGC